MEDYKIILYILAAVAYFLYNTWRKAFKGEDESMPQDEPPKRKPVSQPQRQPLPSSQQPQPRSPQPSSQKPLPQPQTRSVPPAPQPQPVMPKASFEDILRELLPKAEHAQEQLPPVPKPVKERAERAAPVHKPQPVRSFERAEKVDLTQEEREEAREATRREQRKRMVTEPYSPWKATVKTNKYADILRNPQTARDAFVLSEIFQRKYK